MILHWYDYVVFAVLAAIVIYGVWPTKYDY